MIILLSPAKTINDNPPKLDINLSIPQFLNESSHLIRQLKKLKQKDLQQLFDVNQELARLNYERIQMWEFDHSQWTYSPAILTFIGEVFRGLDAQTMNFDDLTYSQDHLRILSGLFGILRPLDNMRPYRLEMGTPLKNRRGKDLYEFWRVSITKELKNQLNHHQDRTIINLASKEYISAINLSSLNARVIDIQFKDFKNGQYKFMTVYGKNARGKMTRFILENRIQNPEDLMAFNLDGYNINTTLSKADNLVFTRG
jgi:cytoplasmic iron level regulating protein YaaA (DUF328/UPF0246 family)